MEATFFFKENLTKKTPIGLRIEDPFVREILEIWSDTFFEGRIVSKDHFCLFYL